MSVHTVRWKFANRKKHVGLKELVQLAGRVRQTCTGTLYLIDMLDRILLHWFKPLFNVCNSLIHMKKYFLEKNDSLSISRKRKKNIINSEILFERSSNSSILSGLPAGARLRCGRVAERSARLARVELLHTPIIYNNVGLEKKKLINPTPAL